MTNEIPKATPQLAIHLITNYAEIDKVKAAEEPAKFVDLLVRAYNGKKKSPTTKKRKFKIVDTHRWNPKEHNGNHLIAYSLKRKSLSAAGLFITELTQKERATYQDTYHDFAFFVYFAVNKVQQEQTTKQTKTVWVLFTLTSNQAFRLIRPYCDYSFPIRMAFRLLKPSCMKKEVVPLVGTKEASIVNLGIEKIT